MRGVSGLRAWIGDPEFPAEPGRYHLFAAFNRPWRHRVALARNVLGLRVGITMDVAFPGPTDDDDPEGPDLRQFAPDKPATLTGAPLPECTAETGTGAGHRLMTEIHAAEGSGERSASVLHDKKAGRIANNERAEIIRMLDAQAEALGCRISAAERPHLHPDDPVLRDEIDALNQLICVTIDNGACKTGFFSDQAVHAAAFETCFETLSNLDERLADGRPFLTEEGFAEADPRLSPTLHRRDPAHFPRRKLNGANILDHLHLWRWR